MATRLHQFVENSAKRQPHSIALAHKLTEMSYAQLNDCIARYALAIKQLGLSSGQRIGIYLAKQFETVISLFAASKADCVFVPINPLLKPSQVKYILKDCQVSLLITSASRHKQLSKELENFDELSIILTDCKPEKCPPACLRWEDWPTKAPSKNSARNQNNAYESETCAILYTSGSTGQPKGVMLTHQNMILGAKSVAEYLNNTASDRLLAVLPLSFDYGLSQLTTAFFVGAQAVLFEYLLPRDVLSAVKKYAITGLAAVPPLWIQLADLEWPSEAQLTLRYFTNSGGAMPKSTLRKLREQLPNSQPYLMYGLTEAFRSTYLEPTLVDKKPDSIGKAIPHAKILVVNDHGNIAQPFEEGELVHIGPLVAQGYWQSPDKTAKRFKPVAPKLTGKSESEIGVWSGDRVKADEEGYLYFVGRQDEMIKQSGYRISPAEIEDILLNFEPIHAIAALGISHPRLGQGVVLVIETCEKTSEAEIIQYCKKQLPNFMQPQSIQFIDSLPKNPNGKINRTRIKTEFANIFSNETSDDAN